MPSDDEEARQAGGSITEVNSDDETNADRE